MNSEALITIFLLSTLLFKPAKSMTDHQSWCQNTAGNYTTGSIYQQNLNSVLSSLTNNAPLSFFSNATASDPDVTNAVYGLYYCKGDVSRGDCGRCVAAAAEAVKAACPQNKEAVIWYRKCTLRYAHRPIFSVSEEEPHAWWCSPSSTVISMDSGEFNAVLQRNLDGLIKNVAYNRSRSSSSYSLRFYGDEEVGLGNGGRLSLQAQCTPDISPGECEWCLQAAAGLFPGCCDVGRSWATICMPSCHTEYRIRASVEPTLLPLPTPTTPLHFDVVKAVVPAVIGLLLLLGVCFWLIKRKKSATPTSLKLSKVRGGGGEHQLQNTDCLCFSLHNIQTATKGFSLSNKLGEGGFGIVYQGVLENGERIAVKRLSQRSGQGDDEFKTEVAVVAKLQHKNLVRLVGFCVNGEERLLVYEYMPNLSLDRFLFDSTRSSYLTWPVRFKIIAGIARGLQYLHEDSRVTIIHRDLKTSNILLDEELEPKIADFGMARLVKVNQTSENTSKVLGTFGYMAPEYVSTGRFSLKSDIYSFGVMILEILSGKSSTQLYQISQGEGLVQRARAIWDEGTIEELMDPVLENNFTRIEAQRCLQIGLLCVQQDESNRPSINSVLLMLGSHSVELQSPVWQEDIV